MFQGLVSGFDFEMPILFSWDGVMAIVFFFTIYSFFGWLLENSYSYARKRVFFKDNFFFGPFKPMYGFAPMLLVFLIGKDMHWLLVLTLCFLIPTLVEYCSGFLLEWFFGRKWWDYSGHKLQLQGHICFSYSICWIALSLLCLAYVHPMLVTFYGAVGGFWALIWPTVALYFLGELIFAIRRHIPEKIRAGNPIR
ncbi:putative ABC transporter permease [Fredinandcohnia onubensis]|uniref:putative ABC transporter permease n=1 Tax=Fredinandcohnia onubensis TaxID=1571209 RepID=UPI000C0BBA2D|nr:putative ABC transporter permease [Fredinandcohnia onubensis]